MNIADAILYKYPDANPAKDFIVRDDVNSLGPYIFKWNLPYLEPTPQELQVWYLESYKAHTIIDFNCYCERDILKGFTSRNGHYYGFDMYDQMNFTQELILLVTDATINVIPWKTLDAGAIDHTRQQFLDVINDGTRHKWGYIKKYWTKKYEINIATTVEQAKAVVWDDNMLPKSPTGLMVQLITSVTPVDVTTISATLGWDKVTGVDILGYNLYMNGVKLNGLPFIQNNSYVVNDLKVGTSYLFTVTVVDIANTESDASQSVNLKP